MQRTDEQPADDFERWVEPHGNGWAVVGQGGKMFCSGSPSHCEDWLDAWENRRRPQIREPWPFELARGMAGAMWAAMTKPLTTRLSKAA